MYMTVHTVHDVFYHLRLSTWSTFIYFGTASVAIETDNHTFENVKSTSRMPRVIIP